MTLPGQLYRQQQQQQCWYAKYLLWFLLFPSVVSGARTRGIKGEHLRRQGPSRRHLTTTATTTGTTRATRPLEGIEWEERGASLSASRKSRQQRELQDNSRLGGGIGVDDEDPFFEFDNDGDMDNEERNTNTSSTNGVAFNSTYTSTPHDGLSAIGGLDVNTTAAPTLQAVVLNAQEASNVILSSAQENLQQGRKGSKDAKSSTKATSGEGSSAAGKVKGDKKATSSATATKSATSSTTSSKVKGSSSKLGAKSKKSTTGAFSASGVSGSKGKGGMSFSSASGIMSVSGASSGKGGKGGKGGSASGSATSGDSGVLSGAQEYWTLTPTTLPPVSNAVAAPSQAPGSAPNPGYTPAAEEEYPPTRTGENVEIDCDAIAQGTADKDAPNTQSFQISSDWVLAEGADFDTVAANAQEYLQTMVAPSIAGCATARRHRRRRRTQRQLQLQRRSLQFISTQSLISNVLFATPTSFGEGSCSTAAPNSCYVTQTGVDIYYYGVDSGIGMRLLAYLQAAGSYDVPDLLAVNNLVVLDSNGNQVGDPSMPAGIGGGGGSSGGSGGSSGTSTNGDVVTADNSDNSVNGGSSANAAQGDTNADDDSGLSTWSKTVIIGVSACAAFLAVILCYIIYRRCWQREQENEGKFDFGSLPPEQAVSRDEGEPRPLKGGRKASATEDVFQSRTWPNEEDDADGDSDDDSEVAPNRYGVNGEATEIRLDPRGNTHVCTSSYCEVCRLNPPQTKFVPSAAAADPYDELPTDASRSYFAEDTVNL